MQFTLAFLAGMVTLLLLLMGVTVLLLLRARTSSNDPVVTAVPVENVGLHGSRV